MRYSVRHHTGCVVWRVYAITQLISVAAQVGMYQYRSFRIGFAQRFKASSLCETISERALSWIRAPRFKVSDGGTCWKDWRKNEMYTLKSITRTIQALYRLALPAFELHTSQMSGLLIIDKTRSNTLWKIDGETCWQAPALSSIHADENPDGNNIKIIQKAVTIPGSKNFYQQPPVVSVADPIHSTQSL